MEIEQPKNMDLADLNLPSLRAELVPGRADSPKADAGTPRAALPDFGTLAYYLPQPPSPEPQKPAAGKTALADPKDLVAGAGLLKGDWRIKGIADFIERHRDKPDLIRRCFYIRGETGYEFVGSQELRTASIKDAVVGVLRDRSLTREELIRCTTIAIERDATEEINRRMLVRLRQYHRASVAQESAPIPFGLERQRVVELPSAVVAAVRDVYIGKVDLESLVDGTLKEKDIKFGGKYAENLKRCEERLPKERQLVTVIAHVQESRASVRAAELKQLEALLKAMLEIDSSRDQILKWRESAYPRKEDRDRIVERDEARAKCSSLVKAANDSAKWFYKPSYFYDRSGIYGRSWAQIDYEKKMPDLLKTITDLDMRIDADREAIEARCTKK